MAQLGLLRSQLEALTYSLALVENAIDGWHKSIKAPFLFLFRETEIGLEGCTLRPISLANSIALADYGRRLREAHRAHIGRPLAKATTAGR
jgi:hypothetical protein